MENNKIPTELEIKSNWNQLKGGLKQRFGDLTDDDMTYLEGKQDELVGYLQQKLQLQKDEVLQSVRELVDQAEKEVSEK